MPYPQRVLYFPFCDFLHPLRNPLCTNYYLSCVSWHHEYGKTRGKNVHKWQKVLHGDVNSLFKCTAMPCDMGMCVPVDVFV